MFENLVNQEASKFISSDIVNNSFPGSVLFSGSDASGKLTAALEVARVYSCRGPQKGVWTCECNSCLQHKSLTASNLLLIGPRDCTLEISASKESFLTAYENNASYLNATRYLFLRSVRKLTLRFNGILWQGNSSVNKIGSIIEKINENLELLDFPQELPPLAELKEICDTLESLSFKLEKDYLYDSIPVAQIRNMEDWARIKSDSGKKTVIIEHADRMKSSVRNALLKILEEPPADVNFILLSSRRNTIIPTILSRVRTYDFKERTQAQQSKVIKLVFHKDNFNGTISNYLKNFLPVSEDQIKLYAKDFYTNLVSGSIPNISMLIKNCNNFDPRLELRIFLAEIAELQRPLMKSEAGCDAAALTLKALRECWENVTVYYQSVQSSFEILVREISKINVTHGRILCADM